MQKLIRLWGVFCLIAAFGTVSLAQSETNAES